MNSEQAGPVRIGSAAHKSLCPILGRCLGQLSSPSWLKRCSIFVTITRVGEIHTLGREPIPDEFTKDLFQIADLTLQQIRDVLGGGLELLNDDGIPGGGVDVAVLDPPIQGFRQNIPRQEREAQWLERGMEQLMAEPNREPYSP
jgi:hypothetical protein